MWNFPLFLRGLIFSKYMCAWCPHYNSKVFNRRKLLKAVILVGMSSPNDSSNQICDILKITENCWFLAFSLSYIFEGAREKMLNLGLPEVRMIVELGLDVIPRKFWYDWEITKNWKFSSCNADIRHKSFVEKSRNFGFGAGAGARLCSTGVAPSSMKMWFSKSSRKILYLSTLVCAHHTHSLCCGIIPNFEIFTAHKCEKSCSLYYFFFVRRFALDLWANNECFQ